jgi:dihydrofolate reductase
MEIIVAVAKNRVIGDTINNTLLWDLPEDLSRFAKMTRGHVVIMGHNTFRSLPNGPLKNRVNIVLTRSPHICEAIQNLFFVDISKLWGLIQQFIDKRIFVIGGSTIYRLLYPFCSKVHYTCVDLEPLGDVMFPFSQELLKHNSESVDGDAMHDEWMMSRSGVRYKYITYNIKH